MDENKPRWCGECAREQARAARVQANREWKECEVCWEPTCTEHGHEYRNGFEHESCHEAHDYSRNGEF